MTSPMTLANMRANGVLTLATVVSRSRRKNTLIAGRATRAQSWGSSSREVSRGIPSLMVDVLTLLRNRAHFLGIADVLAIGSGAVWETILLPLKNITAKYREEL